MKKRSYFCVLLFFSFVLFVATGSEGADGDRKVPDTFFSITLEDGLFSIEADNIPLDLLINDLYEKTGVKFIIHSGSLPSETISLSFKKLSFYETLSRILKGYNYIIIGEASLVSSRVIILSSRGSGETFRGGFDQRGEIFHSSSQASFRPKSLDECEKLESTVADIRLKRANRPFLSKAHDKLMFDEDSKAINEAKIKRAQKVLEMAACSHLWGQAIEELIIIQDERVTFLLIDSAIEGKTIELREKAVEILSRNTAKSGYRNLHGIQALKNLAASSDPRVSQKAQQALQDYENYINGPKSRTEEMINQQE